jgi:hypothetical protein
VVVRGKAAQESYAIEKPRTNIGRMQELTDSQQRIVRRNDIVFEEGGDDANATVSRAHAHIRFDRPSGQYRICDDESEFGTRIFREGRSIEVPAGNRRGERLCAGRRDLRRKSVPAVRAAVLGVGIAARIDDRHRRGQANSNGMTNPAFARVGLGRPLFFARFVQIHQPLGFIFELKLLAGGGQEEHVVGLPVAVGRRLIFPIVVPSTVRVGSFCLPKQRGAGDLAQVALQARVDFMEV